VPVSRDIGYLGSGNMTDAALAQRIEEAERSG
jgi:hypothetical protein